MMMCNPSVQVKAQKALDEVLTGERLPGYKDRSREELVYIEAIILEVLRQVIALSKLPDLKIVIQRYARL